MQDKCTPQNNMDCYYNKKWKEEYIEKDLDKNIISYFSTSQNEINEDLRKIIKSIDYVKTFKKSYKKRQQYISATITNEIQLIQNIRTIDEFISILTKLSNKKIHVLGEIHVIAHHSNPKKYVLNVDESILTLGNIDAYRSDSPEMKSFIHGLHKLYDYVSTIGYNKNPAEKFIENIIVCELMLSDHCMSFIDSTDPLKTANSMTVKQFLRKYPCKYYKSIVSRIPLDAYVNISNKQFTEFIAKLLNNYDKFSDMLIDYMVFRYIGFYANYLEIDSILKIMIPHYEIKDRYFQTICNYLGPFVEDAYEQTINMNIRKPLIKDIFENIRSYCMEKFSNNKFFSTNTNSIAIKKLQQMKIIIGKSNSIYTISDFPVLSDNFYDNIDKLNEYYHVTGLNLVGKPIDRSIININNDVYSFYLNAYYEQTLNIIYLPSSICSNYFFNPDLDPIYNYGSIGTIIGHEIMHSFDNNGANYNQNGNLVNWWSESDYEKFNTEVNKIKSHYDRIRVLDLKINGSISISENFADIVGIKASLRAYIKKYMNGKINYDVLKIFFGQWVNTFKSVTKIDYLKYLIANDVHAPGIVRVNAPFSHIVEYYQTYNLQPTHNNYLEVENRTTFLD